MAKNMRMITDNRHDSATLTATSQALPVDYTKRSGRSYVWRSTSAVTQVIEGTLANADFLQAVVLYKHNLSDTATVMLELLLDEGGTETVVWSSSKNPAELKPLGEWIAGVDPWGLTNLSLLSDRQLAFWMEYETLATGYRITIEDDLNPDGYLQVARIFVGSYFSPRYNPQNGMTLDRQYFGEHSRTEAGSLRTIGTGAARRVDFDLGIMNPVDLDALSIALVKVQKSTDVYISVYPERGGTLESEHAFACRLASNFSTSNNFFNNWQAPLTFEEI